MKRRDRHQIDVSSISTFRRTVDFAVFAEEGNHKTLTMAIIANLDNEGGTVNYEVTRMGELVFTSSVLRDAIERYNEI